MSKNKFFVLRFCLAAVALLVLLAQTSPVFAHGDGETLQLWRVPVGPYYLTAWSLPAVMRVGEVHFAAAITDEVDSPMLDCQVTMQIRALTADQEAITLVTRAPSVDTNFRHEIELNLEEPGRYLVQFDVVDPNRQGDSAAFEMNVTAVPLWLSLTIYAAIAFTALVGLWLLQQGLVMVGWWRPAGSRVARIPHRRRESDMD